LFSVYFGTYLYYLYKIKILKQLIDNIKKKWVCIDAFKRRIKLENCAHQILVQLSADAYREIETSFELIKESDENEQNVLFAMVRPILHIIKLSLF
jgi:hypothetical protein